MPSLFDPIAIGGVTVRNRIAKSAMAEGRCDPDGRPTPALARLYERWARGGVGLLITGMAHVQRGFSFSSGEIGIYSDEVIAPLSEVSAAAHRHGASIFLQLCHAPPQIPRAKAKRLGAIAPSAGFCKTNWLFNRAIRGPELRELVKDFASAAKRARAAGFDGVQIHAAHGYLLSRMLSPRHNKRRDGWGGTLDGRMALLSHVCDSVRRASPDDFPVTVKLNAHDAETPGLEVDEAVEIGRRLEAQGVAAIEVSAGTADVGLGCWPNKGEIPLDIGKEYLKGELPFLAPIMPLLDPYFRHEAKKVALTGEAYFLPLAERFAAALSIPVMCVGGVRSLATARRIVEETEVAMVSLARPLVRQPALPRMWSEGRSPVASCASCNRCFVKLGFGEPLRCWQEKDAAPA